MSEKFLIGKKNPKQTTQIFYGVVENEKTHTCTVLNGNINIFFYYRKMKQQTKALTVGLIGQVEGSQRLPTIRSLM